MKRKFSLGFLLVFLSAALMAQDPMFSQGDKVLNLGIGFGSALYSGSFYHTSVPALSASYEVGIKDNVLDVGSIGVGGYLGYSAFKSTYDNYGIPTAGKFLIWLLVQEVFFIIRFWINLIHIPV